LWRILLHPRRPHPGFQRQLQRHASRLQVEVHQREEEELRVVGYAGLEAVVLREQQNLAVRNSADTLKIPKPKCDQCSTAFGFLVPSYITSFMTGQGRFQVTKLSSTKPEFSISTSVSIVFSLAACLGPLSVRRPMAASASFWVYGSSLSAFNLCDHEFSRHVYTWW